MDVGRDCSAPDTDCLGVAITLNTRRSRALCCEHQALRSRRRGGLYPHSQRMIKSRREIGARDRRREDNSAYRRTPSEQLGINTRLLQPEHLGDQLNNTSTPGFQPVHISVKSNDGSNSRATADRRQAEDRNSVIPNNNCPRLASHNQPHRRLPLNTEGTLTASNGNRMPIYTCGGRVEPPQLEMKPIQTSLNIQNRKFIPGTSQHPLLQAATLHRHSIPATESTTVYRNKVQLPHSTTLAQHLLTYSSKSPLNPSLPNSIYFVKKHSALSTLSYKSNPSQAWGTYAPGRAYAFISKDLVSHTKHSLNILHEIQLLNSYTILNKKSLTYPLIAHSNSVWLQLSPRNMTGPTKPHTRHHNSNHANDIVMDDITPPSKRTSPNSTKSLHKKSKSNSPIISLYRDPSQMEFWYRYPIMETIAYEAGIPPIPIAIPLDELIATGYVASEAAELCSGIMSFPRVQQKLWPTTRPDGIEGQHINITQLPFDIEVNPKTSLSLDYHILLHFEKSIHPFSQDQVMKKLLMRFQSMEIQPGDLIGEPIAVLCHGPKTARVWSGMAKVRHKHPSKDGIALLSGKRILAITLDNDALTIAKVAKAYDSLAPSNLLTVKINTDNIRELVAHQLFKTVVEESFKRGHEFELAQVQKTAGETYGWLITTSPEQVEKISRHKIPILGELLTPVISSGDQLS